MICLDFIASWQLIQSAICIHYAVLLNPFTPFKVSQLITLHLQGQRRETSHWLHFPSHGLCEVNNSISILRDILKISNQKQKDNSDKFEFFKVNGAFIEMYYSILSSISFLNSKLEKVTQIHLIVFSGITSSPGTTLTSMFIFSITGQSKWQVISDRWAKSYCALTSDSVPSQD